MLELTITKMTCGHCVRTVTEAVRRADPRAQVRIDLPTHQVRIESQVERETIVAALCTADYRPD
jgi:copper chaperone